MKHSRSKDHVGLQFNVICLVDFSCLLLTVNDFCEWQLSLLQSQRDTSRRCTFDAPVINQPVFGLHDQTAFSFNH